MKLKTTLLTGTMCLALGPVALAQNFIINGSFESPLLPTSPSFSNIYKNGVDTGLLTSWSATGNPATWVILERGNNFGLAPFDGQQFVGFNVGDAPSGGILSQTFGTTIGAAYSVSYVVGRQGDDSSSVGLRGQIVSASSAVLGQAENFPASVGWLAPTAFSFTATTSQTTIRFTDTIS